LFGVFFQAENSHFPGEIKIIEAPIPREEKRGIARRSHYYMQTQHLLLVAFVADRLNVIGFL
jgi:hypothetical protein